MGAVSSWRDVPALLRHCVVAVYNKSTSTQTDGVVRAFKICRDTLAKSGYLSHRGSNEILEGIQLTGKGFERTMRHSREGFDGDKKDKAFENLFKVVQPRLWEYDGPGGQAAPRDSSNVGSARDDERLGMVDDKGTMGDITGKVK